MLRVFPVLGVPLPFMSQGGTSLLSVLVASGVLLAFARTLPEAEAKRRAAIQRATRARASARAARVRRGTRRSRRRRRRTERAG